MEDKEQTKINNDKLRDNPKEKANFLSSLFFWWQFRVVTKGWSKEITEDDIYKPLPQYKSQGLGDKLEKAWQEHLNKQKNPSLGKILVQLFKWELLLYGLVFYPADLCTMILQPWLLMKLLEFFTPNQCNISLHQALLYAGMLSLVNLYRTMIYQWCTLNLTILGMKMRIACSSLIYRKCLTIKQQSLEKTSVGQIVNLLSSDVYKFENCLPCVHQIWISPINVSLCLCYIYYTAGSVGGSGIVAMFSYLPLQMYMLKKMAGAKQDAAKETDHRIRFMNDIICGIQAIKLFSWEKPFIALIEKLRRVELKKVAIVNGAFMLNVGLRQNIARVAIVVYLITASLLRAPVTLALMLSLFNVYENVKNSFTFMFQVGLHTFIESKIAVNRIQEFLLHDYESPSVFKRLDASELIKPGKKPKRSVEVKMKNVSVQWQQSMFGLKNVDFEAGPGDLVAIVGSAGSGKSTLLHVILKEILPSEGRLSVEGSVSYASQEPWIFSASIKQNIIFGQDFRLEKYLKVINVCALEHDLALFPHGDQTRVGERGVMISGGQKARICLARAIYRDADIYVLDDPLSAVDAAVAKHIFTECISGYLRGKCVVLVTHQVQLLENVSKIYQVEKGKVHLRNKFDCSSVQECSDVENVNLKKHQLQNEVKEHGTDSTNLRAYVNYCKSVESRTLLWSFLTALLLAPAIGGALDFFAAFFVILQSNDTFTNFSHLPHLSTDINICIFALFVLMITLATVTASRLFLVITQRASRHLHGHMLKKVLFAPMTFFNEHSSGRILNRFSKDASTIDEFLPLSSMAVLSMFALIFSRAIMINITNYYMIIPTIGLLALTLAFNCLFQRTNRTLKKSEGITRSALFSHVNMSLQGASVIRAASDIKHQVIEEFDRYQDNNSSSAYMFASTFSAFGFWIDILCLVYNLLVTFAYFLWRSEPSLIVHVGIGVLNSTGFIALLQYTLKLFAEVDPQMTSVERVVEYTNLAQEVDDGEYVPGQDWPKEGSIRFYSVSLRYSAQAPLVLKDVAFKAKAGEKVGIVGRTGAGKTSLTSVLFRLFAFEGDVVIDGVNTKMVPLRNLRSRISIIPQEPILFLGTLRKNIDPFGDYTDDEIWTGLAEIELKEKIAKLPQRLDTIVSDKGQNFSVGERQLLCLVRAMLRNNRIIVLDEATANIDLQTDQLIQSTIRNKFRDCTVLTIAHRLNTVIDSDKVLVMDKGTVVEFDHPFVLLQNEDGMFYNYVKKNGENVLRNFINVAERNFHN